MSSSVWINKHKAIRVLVVFLMIGVMLLSGGWIPFPAPPSEPLISPPVAKATYQFAPTGGAIVTGTALPILGMTAVLPEGVNLGSWWATLADDNFHWGLNSTATGYNVHLDIGNVQLNNANKLFIQTEFDLDAAVNTFVQICDWVSSIGVHHPADAQCTTGGWRNLNVNDIAITIATPVAYSWAIYDGYWNSTAIARISTPLTNFVDGTNRIRIRYFSTINSVTAVHIDYLRVFAVVNPVYSPAGVTQISGGAPLGDYSLAIGTGVGAGTMIFYTRYRISIWRKKMKKETKEASNVVRQAFRTLKEEVREQIEFLNKKPGLTDQEKEIRDKLQKTLDLSQELISKEIKDIEKEIE